MAKLTLVSLSTAVAAANMGLSARADMNEDAILALLAHVENLQTEIATLKAAKAEAPKAKAPQGPKTVHVYLRRQEGGAWAWYAWIPPSPGLRAERTFLRPWTEADGPAAERRVEAPKASVMARIAMNRAQAQAQAQAQPEGEPEDLEI